MYKLGSKERSKRGLAGRKWAIKNGFTKEAMCADLISSIETCFDNFKPRNRFSLIDTSTPSPKYPAGIIFDSKIQLGE